MRWFEQGTRMGRFLAGIAAVVALVAACAPSAAPQAPPAQKAAEPAKAEPAPAQSGSLRPFTFILDFVPSGEYAAYWAALEKGWYREEGLDVKIVRGAGSGDTVKRIAAGQGDAGSADFSAIVAARANEDVKVKAIGAYYRRPPHSIFVLADSPIKVPKDLEGKSLAISQGNSHQILFPLFGQLAGFNADSVNWVTMDANAMGPSLISKSVDAVPFFAVHEVRINKIAQQQGTSIRVAFRFTDYGLDMYSLAVFAREDSLTKDADPLRKFLKATYRGMDYARDNVEESARYVLKEVPDLDPDGAIGGAKVASTFQWTDEVTSGKVAPGQFEPERVVKSRDIYTKYLNLKREVPPDELYTNDLVPDTK